MTRARKVGFEVLATLALLGACAGCGGVDDPEDESISDELEALSATKAPATPFNNAEQGHTNVCVTLKNGFAQLRYPDFSPTGYIITNDDLHYGAVDALCPEGTARLDHVDTLDVHDPLVPEYNGKLVFHRGGWGYQEYASVRYGFISLDDIAESPLPKPVGKVKPFAGNGVFCTAAKGSPREGHYEIAPKEIPEEMRYCHTKSSCNSDSTTNPYTSYGDPAQQGPCSSPTVPDGTPCHQTGVCKDRLCVPADGGEAPGFPIPQPQIHYTYLVWSWFNVTDGGVVRAILKPHDVFHRCDVPHIKLASVDASGNKNGWVKAIYGKTRQGGNWIYGWTVHSHRHGSEPVVYHLDKLGD